MVYVISGLVQKLWKNLWCIIYNCKLKMIDTSDWKYIYISVCIYICIYIYTFIDVHVSNLQRKKYSQRSYKQRSSFVAIAMILKKKNREQLDQYRHGSMDGFSCEHLERG